MGCAGYCRRVCFDCFDGVTMTDRELLELAAKASGIDYEWDGSGRNMLRAVPFREYTNYEHWNPLTDDGDALRLASKLEMMIDFMDCRVCAGHAHPEVVIDFDDGDHKRAIVLAAAAIGETL